MADRLCVRLQSGVEGFNSLSWLSSQRLPFPHPAYKDGKKEQSMATYLKNGPQLLANEMERIKKHISAPNRDYLLKYQDFLALNGRKDRTQWKRLYEIRAVCELGVCNDFMSLTKEETEEIVRRINKMKVRSGINRDHDLNVYSKARTKLTFKQFIKWLLGSDADPIIGWVKMGKAASIQKLPTDMLTESDIERLVSVCLNPRDRFLIMLMWDSGARIGEILNCRIKDLSLSANGPSRITLNGKTGLRVTPLSVSVPYAARYINEWRADAKGDDPLFITIQKNRPTKNAMDYPNVKKMLSDAKARCKLDKRLHAHLFRFSRCTFLISKGMSTTAMTKFFGWSSAKMIQHYGKLDTSQVEQDFYRATGMKTNGEPERPKLIIKKCYKCHANAETTDKFCPACGTSLDRSEYEDLLEQIKMKEELDDIKMKINILLNSLDQETQKKLMRMMKGEQ